SALRWIAIGVFGRDWGFVNYLDVLSRIGKPLERGDLWLLALLGAAIALDVWLIPKLIRPLAPGRTPMGSAIGSAALTVLFGLVIAAFAGANGAYGSPLFVWLPFVMGMLGPLLYGRGRFVPIMQCLSIPVYSVTVLGVVLLAVAAEGIVCLAMALP